MNKEEHIENLKQSKSGIYSFAISIIFGLGFWFTSICIIAFKFGLTKNELGRILGLLGLIVVFMHIAGILLGILGLCQRNCRKSYAKSGVKLNLMFLFLIISLTMLGIFSDQIRLYLTKNL